jgi:hypothetical protein
VALSDVPAPSGRPTGFLPATIALVLVAVSATAGAALGRAQAGPVPATSPTLRGDPSEGNRLVATPGSWQGSGPLKYRYRWYRCDTMGNGCGVLQGVTAAHYRLGAGDVGHTVAVNVRATDSTGSTNGYSSLIGPVAGTGSAVTSLVQPAISGSAALGGSIQVDTGKWQPTPKSVTYQWIRCNAHGRGCSPIIGDRGPSHAIVRRDVKHALVAIVQAMTGATSRAVLSRASGEVGGTGPTPPAGGNPPQPPAAVTAPVATAMPTVGTAVRQGKKLTGAQGTWSGSGIQYAFQWYRCDPAGAHCRSIHGSTKATYTAVAADVGNTLGLTVRATNSAGTASAYASLVGPITSKNSPLYATAQPSISGNPVPGQTLQVTTGSWSERPSGYAYKWMRCNANGRVCSVIPGATASTFGLTAADVGHVLVAVVHAALDGISNDTWSVGAHVVAPPGPQNSVRPTVVGEAIVGKQLTGAAGTWSGTGEIQYAYQWYRCDAAGAHCSSIHGSTKATYTEVQKDVGNTLGLTVRAKDTAGTTSAYASLIGPVAAKSSPLYSTAQPSISGNSAPGQTLQVSTGNWSQAPTAYNYRWDRCNQNGRVCVQIANAIGVGYTVTTADAGHTVLAIVQATAGGLTQPIISTGAPIG